MHVLNKVHFTRDLQLIINKPTTAFEIASLLYWRPVLVSTGMYQNRHYSSNKYIAFKICVSLRYVVLF